MTMPIHPDNRDRYPSDWRAISDGIKQRAGMRCEHVGEDGRRCDARQYAVGWWRLDHAGIWRWQPVVGNTPARTRDDRRMWRAGEGCACYSDARQFIAGCAWGAAGDPIVIVLTVAHLNHEPSDCRPENLRAMCQRHHLAYDQEHHAANRARRARERLALGDLFDPAAPSGA